MASEQNGNERLISLVFSRRHIWDRRVANYRNRALVERHWRQIANELGFQKSHPIKRKWKSLRDTFLKEMKRVPAEKWPNLDVATYELYGAWPHFKSLLFLRDLVKPRSSIGYTTSNSDSEQQLANYEPERSRNATVTKIYDPIEPPAVPLQMDATATGTSRIIEEFDEDEMFFRSILPHVRKLDPEDKLAFRTEMQNLVQQHVYQKRIYGDDYRL
ncbi:transcription factor Adf-1-like [Wyeomyia smithii]|uniref:transcription factor Adf-1-like n=1 Tax=Wyeomyia smithii TaxID=174621 RepID=UPI002467DD85|nr:transcription factor Adf-1-like [Wyeomyia smithii]